MTEILRELCVQNIENLCVANFTGYVVQVDLKTV